MVSAYSAREGTQFALPVELAKPPLPQASLSLLHKLRWSFIAQSTVRPAISAASSFEPELPKTSQHTVSTLVRVFAHCIVALYQCWLCINAHYEYQTVGTGNEQLMLSPEQLLSSKKQPICCYMLTEKTFAHLTVVSVSA